MASNYPAYSSVTWAAKHPELQAAAVPRRRGALTQADKATRKKASSERKDREESLGSALQAYDDWSDDKLMQIGNEHGLSLEYVQRKLGRVTKYKTKRAVCLRNAISHFRTVKIQGTLCA
jgi:hypothetical protein